MTARLLAVLLLVLSTTWLSPAPAHACTCRPSTEAEQLERASVVFLGTVSDDRASGDTRTYTFAVNRVYRGQVETLQPVLTHVQSSACGLDLTGAGPYVVLGFLQNGEVLASSCGGTRPGAPPAELGAGYPPRAPAPTGLTWTPSSGILTLLIGVACIGYAVVVARRRSSGGPR